MEIITILGLVAGSITTGSSVPQVIKTLRNKETKCLSLWMYVILMTGILLWLTYGFLTKNKVIIIPNLVSLCLTSTMLYLKIRYK